LAIGQFANLANRPKNLLAAANSQHCIKFFTGSESTNAGSTTSGAGSTTSGTSSILVILGIIGTVGTGPRTILE
jgi:hypothetical protein